MIKRVVTNGFYSMNHNYLIKRKLRQASLAECFSKKHKGMLNSRMNAEEIERNLIREKLATAAERRISNNHVSDESTNCLAGEANSLSHVNVSNLQNGFEASSDSENAQDVSFAENAVAASQISVDLFPDESDTEIEQETKVYNTESVTEEELSDSDTNERIDYFLVTPPIKPNACHTVMFQLNHSAPPQPFPATYQDKWDGEHVRMPCSPENLYFVEINPGVRRIESRWDIITRSLLENITSSFDLEEAILSYNKQYIDRWSFRGLHAFFTEVFKSNEVSHFFNNTLPAMVKLALSLPELCTQPIPLLKQHKNHSISLSQKQVGCLLANAFFCTFPRRNAGKKNSEYSSYPDINFNRLFVGTKEGIHPRKAQKLKCLLNYFERITSEEPKGTITFQRKCLNEFPDWLHSRKPLRNVCVQSEGLIEKDGTGMVQVDFANKFVGGGVLGAGCVQEEIRFLLFPELIVSRLFTEKMDTNESLVVIGCEQYNSNDGYGDTFRWTGDYRDTTPRDEWGRRRTQVVAMDAIHFFRPVEQYKPQLVRRELNKAFCSFYQPEIPLTQLTPIATGNWGCGAFRGDPELKSLIQWMAASEANRDMVYFTFGNKKLEKELKEMCDFLISKKLTVGDVWSLTGQYYHFIMCNKGRPVLPLFDFIFQTHHKHENAVSKGNCSALSSSQQELSSYESCLSDDSDLFRNIETESSIDVNSQSTSLTEENSSRENGKIESMLQERVHELDESNVQSDDTEASQNNVIENEHALSSSSTGDETQNTSNTESS